MGNATTLKSIHLYFLGLVIVLVRMLLTMHVKDIGGQFLSTDFGKVGQ